MNLVTFMDYKEFNVLVIDGNTCGERYNIRR